MGIGGIRGYRAESGAGPSWYPSSSEHGVLPWSGCVTAHAGIQLPESTGLLSPLCQCFGSAAHLGQHTVSGFPLFVMLRLLG